MTQSKSQETPKAQSLEGAVDSESTEMRLPPLKLPPNLTFGPFPMTTSQAFHVSPSSLSYSLVNLRPLMPGHTLVCPVRRTPRLSLLSDSETSDLFLTVKRVSAMLERVFKADALNVAVQDGAEAGQSVNHVHVHLIPRRKGDIENGDQIYEWMDGKEGNLGSAWEEYELLQSRRRRKEESGKDFVEGGPDGDAKRVNRTEEEMRKEAEWLRWEMQRQVELDEMKAKKGYDEGDASSEIP